MVRLAIAGEKLFDVSDLELGGQAPSYTFDTLTAFRRQLGPEVELCCLIGADMLDDLPNWHRAREVVDLARIVTAVRLPHSTHSDSTWAKIGQAFSPEQVRRLKEGLLGTPTVEISSSDIRQRVRDGRSITYLTPDSVIGYIESLGLYRRP
jgi:nicotinate-nucleotide adenylyltransferase